MDMNLGKLWVMLRDRAAWRAAVHGVTESDMTRQLSNNDYIFVAKDKMKTELECEKTQKDSSFFQLLSVEPKPLVNFPLAFGTGDLTLKKKNLNSFLEASWAWWKRGGSEVETWALLFFLNCFFPNL